MHLTALSDPGSLRQLERATSMPFLGLSFTEVKRLVGLTCANRFDKHVSVKRVYFHTDMQAYILLLIIIAFSNVSILTTFCSIHFIVFSSYAHHSISLQSVCLYTICINTMIFMSFIQQLG